MFLQDNLTYYFSYANFNVKNDNVDQNLYKYFGLKFHKYFGYYLDREMMKHVKKFDLACVRNEMIKNDNVYDELEKTVDYGNLKVVKWIFKHFNVNDNHIKTFTIFKMAIKQQRIHILDYLLKKYRQGRLKHYERFLEDLVLYSICYKKYKSLEWLRKNFVFDETIIYYSFQHAALDHHLDRLDISKWLVRIVKDNKPLLTRMYDACKIHRKKNQIMKYIKKFL